MRCQDLCQIVVAADSLPKCPTKKLDGPFVLHSNPFVTLDRNGFWLAPHHWSSIRWHVAVRYDPLSFRRRTCDFRLHHSTRIQQLVIKCLPDRPSTCFGYAWIKLSITQAHVKEIAKLRHFLLCQEGKVFSLAKCMWKPQFDLLLLCCCFMAGSFYITAIRKGLTENYSDWNIAC